MDNSNYNILAPNFWQENFKTLELHVIMRQRESKEFAEMLNRLREGNHSKDDILKFKQKLVVIDISDNPLGAPNLFIQNSKVKEFNEMSRSQHVTRDYVTR